MNTVEKAKQEVERREKTLLKLIDDQREIQEKKDALQQDRSKAVRDLAAINDEAKAGQIRKKIVDLEEKLSPLLLKMEGLQVLSKEATVEVEKARSAFQAAQEDQETRLGQFIEDHETDHFNHGLASLPKDMEGILDLYKNLCNRLAEIQVKGQRVSSKGDVRTDAQIDQFLRDLPQKFFAVLQERGLRRSLLRGYGAPLEFFPLFKSNGEDINPGPGPVDPGQVALARWQRRTREWKEEFLKNEK